MVHVRAHLSYVPFEDNSDPGAIVDSERIPSDAEYGVPTDGFTLELQMGIRTDVRREACPWVLP